MPLSILRKIAKNIIIILNLVVAVLYLAGCYSEFFFAAAWWPVGFLTLSLFYLVIILFIFFVFWLFAKPRYALIFVVCIALSWRHITNIIPPRFSAGFSMEKKPNNLRIMSWNVAQFDVMKYRSDPSVYENMIRLVNDVDPDIACFQEMVGGDTLVDLNNSYYKKYSFFSIFDFANKLHFPDYFYAYNYKENFLNQQHFGIIIFSKYPIVNKRMVSHYPNDYNSIFEYVDVVKDADTIRVFNIHLQSLRFSATNLKYIENPTLQGDTSIEKSKNLINKFKTGFLKRKTQADHVRAEIDKSPYPVIVCGDFNDVPNSYPYETIGKGMQDAFAKKGSGMGRTFRDISPTLRIDNIFVDKRYSVNQFLRIDKRLSDHFPIVTDIERLPQ